MLKKIWIMLAILTVVALVAITGGIALADDGSGGAGAATLTKAQIFRRLLRLNEAKLDETLAKWVTNNKINTDQSVKIKTAWQNTRAKIHKVVVARQLLKMDEAKVNETLAKWFADGKITGGQLDKIKAWWVAKTNKPAN